jgi:hypothetical protein
LVEHAGDRVRVQRKASASSLKVGSLKSDKEMKDEVERKIKMYEARGEDIAETGGHYILVLLQGAPWQQVQIFLNTLRASHLPFHIPILVLIPSCEMPSADHLVTIFENLPRTAFKRAGGSVSISDLRKSGMTQARCIALLAGNAGQSHASDRRMVDGAGVTLLACIEGELMESDAPSVPVFLELHQQESVRFLSRFFHRDAVHSKEDDAYDPRESFTNHPRFANGNIFTASCFGATVARSFNMPGIVELMEAITLGSLNAQSSFPWQIYCPQEFRRKSFGDLAQYFLETHNAVCLGMFRLCFWESEADGTRFVITNPDQEMQLHDSDWFFMLGHAAFGSHCFEKGMLVGAENASGANDPEDDLFAITDGSEMVPYGGSNASQSDEWAPANSILTDTAVESFLPQLRTPSRGLSAELKVDERKTLGLLPAWRNSQSSRTGSSTPQRSPSDTELQVASSQSYTPNIGHQETLIANLRPVGRPAKPERETPTKLTTPTKTTNPYSQ